MWGGEPWQPGDLEGEPHLRDLICIVPWVPYRSPLDWSQSRRLHPLAWPSIPWAQDPREGGVVSEKDSRPLL